MNQPVWISFEDALEESKHHYRAILLGNGFSIAQAGSLAYSDLLEVSGIDENSSLKKVFDNFETVDFEKVIKHLETASKVAQAYGQTSEAEQYKDDAKEVRQQLIEAIKKVHPSDSYSIPSQKINSCRKFLKRFDKVFTLNYDLLLYWVLNSLRTRGVIGSRDFSDGFGLGEENDGLKGPFNTDGYCDVYNIHGGLHLFQKPDGDIYKAIASGSNLLSSITNIINQQSQRLLYIAEGTSKQKLKKIRSVLYLNHCLEELRGLHCTLFVFGHSGGINDEHIYDAIFQSGIQTLYYCIYDRGQSKYISRFLQQCQSKNRNRKNISIKFIDVGQMNIWGKP